MRHSSPGGGRGGGGGRPPWHCLFGGAPPEGGFFFRLQAYGSLGIVLVEVYGRVGRSVIWVCQRTQRA